MTNQAETIFAIADLQDRIEGLEREMQRRLSIMDQGLLYLLNRNEWGLSGDERIFAWRMIQIKLHGASPKQIAHRFPPEERGQPIPVADGGIQDRYQDERP
jgi:hypothetical protein